MKRKSIRRKLTLSFLACMVLFGSLAAYVGYRESLASGQEIYRAYLGNCARLAADTLDGVPLMGLLERGREAEYQRYASSLENVRKEMKLKYVYIYVPGEDAKSLLNIFVLGMGEQDAWTPGQTIENGVDPQVLEIFQGKRESAIVVTDNRYGYVESAYRPVYDADGRIQAVAGVDLERNNLIYRFLDSMKGTFALIFAGCTIMLLIFLLLSRRLVIAPLENLTEHMEHFVKNKTEDGKFSQIEIKANDELGRMAEAFNAMAVDVERYVDQVTAMTAMAEKSNTELEVARKIQERSLPDGTNPYSNDTRFEMHATMEPAKSVGGDFYDFFWVEDFRLCVVIGDVAGKGITAALFMMRAKTLVKECALRGGRLSEVLKKANEELCERNEDGMFVTLFLGILDVEDGHFAYANAGHNPPYAGTRKFESIRPKKFCPLGLFEDEEYADEERFFACGEAIFLYTDGVTEAENQQRQIFGEATMQTMLNTHTDLTCKDMVAAMQMAIRAFANGAMQSDDITMLMLRWPGTQALLLEAKMENLKKVHRRIVQNVGKECPDLNKLYLAAEEIYVNIVNYAYPEEAAYKMVEFACGRQDSRLELRFRDCGKPFNPLERQEPRVADDLEDQLPGGLGISLTRKIMDEMEYARVEEANVLTMRKNLS